MKLKLFTLVLGVVLLASYAFAQEREYELKITAKEVETIGKALAKLPYEEVALLIQKLQGQIMRQQQPPAPQAQEQK